MALPNPSMSFSPFAILTAEEMNDLVENIEALSSGGAVTNDGLATGAGEPGGAWDSWTPSYSQISVGNGTAVAKYKQVGKTVFFKWQLTFGSTTTIAATTSISLPVTSVTYPTVHDILATGVANDANGSSYPCMAKYATATTISLRTLSGSPVTYANVSGTAPFNFTTGDYISVEGSYEAP